VPGREAGLASLPESMPGFHIHRSNRVEELVSGLAELAAEPRGTFLAPEAFVVQGRGMAVYLSMELSRRLSVWATPMLYPRELVVSVAERVLPKDTAPPLSEDLLEWGAHSLIPELLDEPDFSALKQYLADDPYGLRLSRLSARIASVFDQYLTYRPGWIRTWEDGGTLAVPDGTRFQAPLFRALRQRLPHSHLARVEAPLLARLAEPLDVTLLPPRVTVFGLTTLPPLFVRVLAGLSRHVDVHFFAFCPAPGLFDAERDADPLHAPRRRVPVLDALLSSLAFTGADFEAVLQATLREANITPVEHARFVPPRGGSLLARLQSSLFRGTKGGVELLRAAGFEAVPSESAERPSIVVHSCHGAMREVEVLRDDLLALVTRSVDPVRPDEIAVLVPDLETYAPLIEAAFSREPSSPDFVPYSLSDRSTSGQSPVVDAVDRLLGMARGRVTSAEVVDLLLLDAVRQRFDLDVDQVSRVKQWIVESGVRWGMDADHRAREGLPASGTNTFEFGLERLLLGYAMPSAGQRLFSGVLPYDEVEGQDGILLGRFARFVRVLFSWLRDLARPRQPAEWLKSLGVLLPELFGDTPETARELARIRHALEAMVEASTAVSFERAIDVAVVRDFLARHVEAAQRERGFLAGGVTFSALVPMRSIPFRVVCLLGMNEGDFPRSPRPVEFDLVQNGELPRWAGDRSTRDDDRYLFLETIFAARERLIVTYTGRGVRDNRPRPPSTVVSELLDYLEHRAGVERSALVVEHRLQGFSEVYFDGSDPKLWSFATAYARAASAAMRGRSPVAPFLSARLEATPRDELPLSELQRFFRSPAAYFLNRRLGVYLSVDGDDVPYREPLELDELEQWTLGDAVLGYLERGLDLEEIERLLRGAGKLPLGAWGSVELAQVAGKCAAIAEQARARRGGSEFGSVPITTDLGNGRRVTGVVSGVWASARVCATYSKCSARYLLREWLAHVALCASGSARPSYLITRGESRRPFLEQEFAPLSESEARALLVRFTDLYLEGQRRPLPFLPQSSHDYVKALAKGAGSAIEKAADGYERGDGARDPHPGRAFAGLSPPFDDAYERGEKTAADTEFHQLSRAVFDREELIT
jgi:exodeoxyribonuclease V gamma subunit